MRANTHCIIFIYPKRKYTVNQQLETLRMKIPPKHHFHARVNNNNADIIIIRCAEAPLHSPT